MFPQDGGRSHIHQKTEDWYRTHLMSFIDKEYWTPNSPDLNPLNYGIWDEFAEAINWDLVTTKATLTDKLQLSLKKIRPEVVFENCISWIRRSYRMKQLNGDYLHKIALVL